jgi:hypothetical protein
VADGRLAAADAGSIQLYYASRKLFAERFAGSTG